MKILGKDTTKRNINYKQVLILVVIMYYYNTPVSTKKRCSYGQTYYSALIGDCVACPSQSTGCTAMLNNETLTNCLRSCLFPSFTPRKTTANPTKISHKYNHAQSVGIKNPVLISITAAVAFVFVVFSVVISRKFYKLKRRQLVDDMESEGMCKEGDPINEDHVDGIQAKKEQNYNELSSGKPVRQDIGEIPSN